MQAETAYNVIQALPEAEKARLYKMLGFGNQIIKKKIEKQSPVMSQQEFYDAALQCMNAKRAKKYGYELKVV